MFAKKLRRLRDERKETRREVAIAAGITENTIYSLEMGENTNPRLLTLEKLAGYYGVSVGYLCDGDADSAEGGAVARP